MDLTSVRQTIDNLTKSISQQQLSFAVSALLIIYLISFAAEMTWKLIPQPLSVAQQSNANMASNKQSAKPSVDITGIQKLNLFGKVGAKPVAPVQTEAPVTKLNLKLMGVVSSSNAKYGAAIIAKSNKQNTYGVGEKVDGTQAIIREVYADRVILEQSGRRESLMLEGEDYTSRVSTPSYSSKALTPKEEGVRESYRSPERRQVESSVDVEELSDIKEDVLQGNVKITDFIRISPMNKDGQRIGYRLMPGKNRQVFEDAGLKANDIATEINGYDLTDPRQAMSAMGELRTASSITLTVDREGELLSIDFSLPDEEGQ